MNECNHSSICQNGFKSFALSYKDGADDDDDDNDDGDDDDDDDDINRKAALETPFTSIRLPHAFLAHKRLQGSKNNSTPQRWKNIINFVFFCIWIHWSLKKRKMLKNERLIFLLHPICPMPWFIKTGDHLL